MNADLIYDYFTPIEDAIATAFALNQVTCYTPLGEQLLNEAASSAAPDLEQRFQMKRPRVQIMLLPGAAKGILRPATGVRAASGFLREKARNASLTLRLVTEANIVAHRAYVARVLFLVDSLGADANAAEDAEGYKKLLYHRIGGLRCNGGTLDDAPEQGTLQTLLNCDLDFSVLDSAWALLD